MSKKKIAVTNNFPLTNPVKTPITNVLYVVDRSGSMSSYWQETLEQLRGTLGHLRTEAINKKQEVRVTILAFSNSRNYVAADVRIDDLNLEATLSRIPHPKGSTALWSSVDDGARAIAKFGLGRASYAENAYLVNILTDGWNTDYPSTFQNKALADSDTWTFTAACPPGHARSFRSSGFDTDNVIEWAASEAGVREYGEKTRSGISSYLDIRSSGLTKSSAFYVDASKVDVTKLTELSPRPVEVKVETTVREFAEEKTKRPYELGSLFYRLEKPEKLQEHKLILLWHKKDKKLYGDNCKTTVRGVLGLNATGEIRINPGNHGDFDIFVQSGSVNRKLPSHTKVVLT